MVDFTVEGDQVTYTVMVMATSIQVSVQSQDRYGPQGLFSYACTGFTQKPALNDPGHVYLVATGCQGPKGFLDDDGRLTIP